MLRRLKFAPLSSFSVVSSSTAVANPATNPVKRERVSVVKGVDERTEEVSMLRLSVSDRTGERVKFGKVSSVPKMAETGLVGALQTCPSPHKQLQHQADDLKKKLSQRRFPLDPTHMQQMRSRIRKDIASKSMDAHDFDTPDMLSARKYVMMKEVDAEMKKKFVSWRPLDLNRRDKALTYALARFAPNLAAIKRVLVELDRDKNFVPQSVLDYGSGCGTTFWACEEKWPLRVKEYCMIDPCQEMNELAVDIMRTGKESGDLIHKNVNFRRSLPPTADRTFDLVVSAHSFIEMNSYDLRMDTLASLWNRTNKYLVLIESGLYDSFNAIIRARDYVLASGWEVKTEEAMQMLYEKNLLTPSIRQLLTRDERGFSERQRLHLLKEALPADVELPTLLPTGYVFAPCPHDSACPRTAVRKGREGRPCTTQIRWQRFRADGKTTRGDGTERETISYVVLAKGDRPADDAAALPRVIEEVNKSKGHANCTLCTAECGVRRIDIGKTRGKTVYQLVRGAVQGTLLPVNVDFHTGEIDDYDEGDDDYDVSEEDDHDNEKSK
uniref:Methyltransferase-like protein 17, mitochondrial n=1 Tax=Plectus sambesii TaxID=2011161 RepID=A0A914URW9_9BILA